MSSMQLLQQEIKAVKAKWGADVKISKAKKGKGIEEASFPVYIQRKIDQPAHSEAVDVYALPVVLAIDSPTWEEEESPLRVLISSKLPKLLREKMEAAILVQWQTAIQATTDKGVQAWMLQHVFEWVEARFGDLCKLVPDYLDMYWGEAREGGSIRKFAIVVPVVVKEEEIDPEVLEARRLEEERKKEAAAAYWAAKRLARLTAAAESKAQDAAEKRNLAESGLLDRVVKVGKKQQQEALRAKKERKGARQAKTGPRCKKFDPNAKDEQEQV